MRPGVSDIPRPKLLDSAQIAEEFGISREHIRRLMRRKELRA
jgi:DNA-binding IscR family transcriptional regulator